MKNGTRMVILTKGKIITYLTLFLTIILCLVFLYMLSSTESEQAFSGYENIIDRQIFPAYSKEEEKDSIGMKIMTHIFKYSKPEKNVSTETPLPEPTAVPQLISSEKLTIGGNLEIKNATKHPININEYLKKKLEVKGNANILIVHTHTTESYAKLQYTKDAPDRNLDENLNMTAVGKAMNEVFIKNGIKSKHDTTVHDYPSYNSSYQKACATIEKNLKNDEQINIVLDVHRDGITRDDGTKVKLVADINGKPTAQIMLVVGSDTNLTHPNWQKNLTFAAKIQEKAEKMYPGLMRPIDLRKERFNQQLTTGSLIIEVGANGNTLEEAIEGGRAIAEVISEVVK